MRIFILLPGLPVGGMERAAVTLANTLTGRGHLVTVTTYGKGDDTLADELAEGVRYQPKGLKPHRVMGRIPWVRRRWYDDGMWETRATPEQLYKYYVGNEVYDVEIAFFRGLSVKTLSAKRENRYWLHGEVVMYPRRMAWVHNDFTKATGWNYNFKNSNAVREAYASYDHVVCVSQQAQKGFIETIGDTGNLTTIYNMLLVDEIIEKGTKAPEVDVPKHKFNIVLVGRLYDRAKGQCRLVEAVGKLQKEGIDIGVTLVGGGSDETKIRETINSFDASGFVYLTGSQKNPYPYIRQSDLLVCASYYEGYNLTVAEALILGTPVLSTRCTGPVEILDDGCYGMIVDNSTEGLTDGLRKLARDSNLTTHYREMAYSRRDFFNPDKIQSQIDSLF